VIMETALRIYKRGRASQRGRDIETTEQHHLSLHQEVGPVYRTGVCGGGSSITVDYHESKSVNVKQPARAEHTHNHLLTHSDSKHLHGHAVCLRPPMQYIHVSHLADPLIQRLTRAIRVKCLVQGHIDRFFT
jgi:hypothetical protein